MGAVCDNERMRAAAVPSAQPTSTAPPEEAAPWRVSDCDSCGAPETRLLNGLVLGVCSGCWYGMPPHERRRVRVSAEQRYRSLLDAIRRPVTAKRRGA